jgi:hypothetical protein
VWAGAGAGIKGWGWGFAPAGGYGLARVYSFYFLPWSNQGVILLALV